jgi:outer membrane protein TolC
MLTLEEAIATGLKNNFSILIAENDATIAKNNNTAGNAGFLPVLGVNGSVKENIASIKTENSASEVTENDNANTSSLNLDVALDWTLFDGFGMFIRKDRLLSMQNMGETAFQSTVENVVSEIIVAYFTVVQYKNRLSVLQNAIDFSNSRYELTFKKYQIGSSSELAYLQASTDLNADSASYLRQLVALQNSKADLNTILVQDPASDFDVIEQINFEILLSYDAIREALPSVNSEILLAKQHSEIAAFDYRLTHSPKYPQIDFFSDYNYTRSEYDFGQTHYNRSNGPAFGLNLAIPVFDGFNKRRVSSNAKIEAESAKLQLEQIIRNIDSKLFQLYNDYQNNMKLVTLETANLKVAQQNTKIAFEKFRVGEMSDIDLRQIQLSQLEAENSLLVAQYLAKRSETELLRISGKLLRER